MNEQERNDALEELARDRERLQTLWDDVVIATMELEFL